MFYLALQIIVGVFVIFVLNYIWKRRQFYLLASKLPKISIGFVFVKILKKYNSNLNLDLPKILHALIDKVYLHGTPKKVWLGPHLFVILINPEDAKIVLNSWACIEKSPTAYGPLKDVFHNSLSVKSEHSWKMQRKKFIQFFSKFSCDSYVEKFNEISEIFLGKLGRKSEWSEHELEIFGQNIALDAFIKIFTKTDVLNIDDYNNFANLIFSILDISFHRIVRFWLLNDFLFQFSSMHKKYKQNLDDISKFNTKVIQAKLKERQSPDHSNKEKSFLDILLDLHEDGKINMGDLHGEIQSMAIGAFETTSTTIKNMVILLAMHPDVQQKLYEEVKDIFQDTDRPVCVEDTRKMVYLEMVIKETLRVFITVANLARVATKDVKLTEYIIPKGANVVFSPYLMHHNPEYWPDPDKFDPERFSVENSVNRHPYTFLAFSGGVRNCIGYKYEMNLLKTLFSKLVFRYSLQTDATMSDVTHAFGLDIKWNCNFPISIIPRNGYVKI